MGKDIQIIKASNKKIDRINSKKIDRIRVGAYCRVSTDGEEQLSSYNSQVLHYKEMINENSDWEMVAVYADEGISGTQVTKRDEFKRMINDALDNRIDLILTKSISRFARNTLDTLKYVRLLKDNKVAIYFEKENINTMTMNGEMLLTILSSLAQQESESMSGNIKLGLKMRMKRGELVGYNGCLGYDYHPETKSITINEKEAVLVKYIFDRYVEGLGSRVIADEITRLGHKSPKGLSVWRDSTILGIIKNEKYKGDIRLGKTFTVDPLTHRRLENMGEEDQFYITNCHEAIISVAQFNEAQRILKIRGKNSKSGRKEMFSHQYTFSSKIKCGFCDNKYSRRSWHGNTVNYKKIVWACTSATKKGRRFCPDSKGVVEKDIEDAFVDAFNILIRKHYSITESFLKSIELTLSDANVTIEIKNIQKEINKLEDKINQLVDMKIDGIITKDIYENKYHKISSQLQKLNYTKNSLETKEEEQRKINKRMDNFKKIFEMNLPLSKFDKEIFESVIDYIIIGKLNEDGTKAPYAITFIFKTGFSIDMESPNKNKETKGEECKKSKSLYSCSPHDTY